MLISYKSYCSLDRNFIVFYEAIKPIYHIFLFKPIPAVFNFGDSNLRRESVFSFNDQESAVKKREKENDINNNDKIKTDVIPTQCALTSASIV